VGRQGGGGSLFGTSAAPHFPGANFRDEIEDEKKTMKFYLYSTLLAVLLLASQLTAAAQAHTYETLTFDVTFNFDIGTRTFRPGHYQLVFVGADLAVLRDAKKHTIASLITRPIEIGWPSPETKVVFDNQKNRSRLSRICIQYRLEVIDVIGEQLAIRQPPPVFAPPAPFGISSLFDRRSAPGFKQ